MGYSSALVLIMNSYSRSVLQTEFQDSLVDIRIQSDNFERFISPDREEIHYQLQKLDDFSLYYQNLYYQADDWLLNASEEQFSSINYSQAPLYICGFDQFFIHYLDDDFSVLYFQQISLKITPTLLKQILEFGLALILQIYLI